MKGHKLPVTGSFREGRQGSGISELSRELGISDNKIIAYLDLLREPKNVLESVAKNPQRFTSFEEVRRVPEKYREDIKTFTQIYIGIYLFIHFRPFHKTKITDFDKTVIFNSAILLLTTSILFNTYMPEIFKYFHINL